jgi:uncharacterized protein DUF955
MGHKYPAEKPRGYAQLEVDARGVRRALGFDLTGKLPGLKIFESLGNYSVSLRGAQIQLSYAVEELEPGIEAEARFERDCGEIVVCLTPLTYEQLEQDYPRSRFSVFHEIGHAVLHPAELIGLSRKPRDQAALQRVSYGHLLPYQDAEWQANTFAASLAMPALGLEQLLRERRLQVSEVMHSFCVSQQSAEIRIKTFLARKDTLCR